MKTFDLYEHRTLKTQAVKNGFSWPAFFFGPIWMFVKSLWFPGIVWALIFIGLSLVEAVVDEVARPPGLSSNKERVLGSIIYAILTVAWLAMALIPALKGNSWRASNLLKRGYRKAQTVEARNRDEALSKRHLRRGFSA